MTELISAFNNHASNQSDSDVQTSFHFDSPPKLIFVQDLQTLKRADDYEALDTFTFSEHDQTKINNTIAEINKSGGYDGNQLLIEQLYHNADSNTLYIVAKKAKYSFIRTLQKAPENGGFGEESSFYRKTFCTAGVRAPFITEKDDYTFFMMRTRRPTVFSVAAGLLEPPEGKLHPSETEGNLVEHVALNEAMEEFLAKDNHFTRPTLEQLHEAKIEINKQFGIRAIAMRRAKDSSRVEIEFLCPLQVKCHHENMSFLITRDNTAKDAYEHNREVQPLCIPLSAEMRTQAEAVLMHAPEDGKYVRDPIVAVTSILANPRHGFFPRYLPGTATTEFIKTSSLSKIRPQLLLTSTPNEEDEDETEAMTYQLSGH